MRLSHFRPALAATLLLSALPSTIAIALTPTDPQSVKAAASEIAHSLMTWYTGNLTGGTPGLLPAPYFWWEGGATWGALIDYWYYTGDDTYNDVVTQALQFQASPTLDFMPTNQTTDEGNDDQVFWGFAAMTAAEYKFPNPPAGEPQWLTLAQGVLNSQITRWIQSEDVCGGGLRWQIFTWNAGYGYKNAPSNAGFVNLAARLYSYTHNATYAHWANKGWDWMVDVGLISDHDQGPGYSVYDGTFTNVNCSHVGEFIQWTYSAGMLLNSAAIMWNITQDPIWETRVYGIWNASNIFFNDGILWEQACERPGGQCDTDQYSFKSYFARYMATSTKWMPQLYDLFSATFSRSASAAASQCTGTVAGLYGNACGFDWTDNGKWDGTYGVGQQLDALQMVMTNLIQDSRDPVSAKTGGISVGDPSAGTGGDTSPLLDHTSPITTASRAGAGILTAFVIVSWLGAIWWMWV